MLSVAGTLSGTLSLQLSAQSCEYGSAMFRIGKAS